MLVLTNIFYFPHNVFQSIEDKFKICFEKVQNIVRKGENAGNQYVFQSAKDNFYHLSHLFPLPQNTAFWCTKDI